jgi:hypothetical protein
MKDLIDGYVKRVRELAEHVRGNEQATKQSLVGPLFTLLGYDLTDPRECVPEFRADFGKDRSVKPVDWAFVQSGRPLFFVEAKEASRKLVGYDEQLVLAAALQEWVKQTMLSMAIDFGARTESQQESASRIETTPEELEGFATVQKLLGPDRPVAYEDTISYFKIHLKERYTWVMCRFYFGRKRPTVWVPLTIEEAGPLASQFPMMTPQQGWTCLSLDSPKDLDCLGDLLRKAYDQQRANRVKVAEGAEKVSPPKADPTLSDDSA